MNRNFSLAAKLHRLLYCLSEVSSNVGQLSVFVKFFVDSVLPYRNALFFWFYLSLDSTFEQKLRKKATAFLSEEVSFNWLVDAPIESKRSRLIFCRVSYAWNLDSSNLERVSAFDSVLSD